MIQIGLSTWADHPSLSVDGKEKSTLIEYAGHFPIVEVDSSFYAIPSLSNVINWKHQVPENFKFIFKAYKSMTLHDFESGVHLTDNRQADFDEFSRIMEPLVKSNQLSAILFQFPPSFRCEIENIRYLLEVRKMMKNLPIAIEFRHASWFRSEVKSDTLAYLKRLNMIHVIVDEPFDGNQGMPLIVENTSSKQAILRLHGRNQAGWFSNGKNWRHERTNYRYSTVEIKQIADIACRLDKQVDEVVIIFNNNGNHDAVDNANELQQILGLHFEGLGPVQIDLF